MTTLALDTATRVTTVALCPQGSDPLEARDDPPAGARPRHATHLLPLAADVLARAGATWADVDRVAIGVGPGTFTGLRIGLASARAIAQARRIPLVGISTLASLALGAWPAAEAAGCDLLVAVIDARRHEVFAAAWPLLGGDPDHVLTDPASAVMAPCAVRPQALAEQLAVHPGRALAVGDGAVAFRGELERIGALVADDTSDAHRVTARNHCRLARLLPDAAPGEVTPEYLRVPDAELKTTP